MNDRRIAQPPEYRVIAAPWYDHDRTSRPEHPDGAGHDSDCVAGFTLEIHRRNPDMMPPLGDWQLIGMMQTNSRGTLDLREVHRTVIDYVVTLSLPNRSNITTDRIKVYAEVS